MRRQTTTNEPHTGITNKRYMANRSIIEQTFNYIYFVFDFDFCNRSEMNALYNCLRQAWEWGHPPVKDDGKDEVRE